MTAVSENGQPVPERTDRLEKLMQKMVEMEKRHQREMADLRAQLKAMAERIGTPDGDPGRVSIPGAGLDERVAALEEELEIVHEDQASLIERDEYGVDVDFYATLEYENFDDSDSQFDARNIELLINARLGDRLKAGAEIEFERTAKTSGSSNRTGEVEVEQGWLEYYISEAFKPRFGVILAPFGKYNLEHFDSVQELTDRPIVMRRVVPVTWAEAGVGFSGEYLFGGGGDRDSKLRLPIDYELYLVNGLTDDVSDTSLRDARGGFGSDNNDNKALVGHVGLFPATNFEAGFSGYWGKYDEDNDNSIRGIGFDFKYARNSFGLVGEYARFDLDSGFAADGVTEVPDYYYGYYLQSNYHFWPAVLENTFLGRGFAHPQLTASLRYGMARIDGVSSGRDNEEQRWTFGFNYRPVETFVFKFEYQLNDTKNESLERGNRDGFVFSTSGAF